MQKLPLPLVLFALSVQSFNLLTAQEINEKNFVLYTKQQGLSDNVVTDVTQDSTGYLWIATGFGLNRFNGNNFVQFHSNRDTCSLPIEYVSGLVWLNNRELAAYTGKGLHIVNTRRGESRNLLVPWSDKKYQYKFNTIQGVKTNSTGDVFVVTRSGFYHFDKNNQLLFRYDYYTNEEVASTPFGFGRNLLRLDEQRFAIISSVGIYYYNAAKRQFKKMDATDCPELKEFLDYPRGNYEFFQPASDYLFIINLNTGSNDLVCINVKKNQKTITGIPLPSPASEFDHRSTLVAVSDTLLYLTGNVSGFYKLRLDPRSGNVQFYHKKYFPTYYCSSLFADVDNNLWIATNKGLLKQDNGRMHVEWTSLPSSLQDSFPTSVIDDIYAGEEKLYAATRGDGSLLIFNKKPLHLIKRISFDQLTRSPNGVYRIRPTGDGSLFIGTNGPLFSLNIKTERLKEMALEKWDKTGAWIADLCKDRNQNIWIASDYVYKYDASTKKISIILTKEEIANKIQWPAKIREDASGNIWIAGHGLMRYNVQLNKVDRVLDSFPSIRMPDNQVPCFAADESNNLWINSNNNGLICYNIDKGTFKHYTRDNGLPDNDIASMIIVQNKLWVASNSGISCLDLRTLNISTFGKEEGFPDLPIARNSNFFYDSAFNKLYIGFTNAIAEFDPGILFQKSHPPKLFIESIAAGDQPKCLFPEHNFRTSWRNNEIIISIGSIDFFTSNGQRFAYRMDDDTDWQHLGTQNMFSISNLSPGHHSVKVKLFSISNRWPELEQEIDITVLTPFWKQPWFIAAAILALLGMAYMFLKWRTRIIEKREQAKTHIQALKAEEYKNQFELEQISNYFSFSLAGIKNVDDVLWDVAKNLIGRMSYVDCMIYLWNKDKTKMIQKASYGPKGDPVAITTSLFDVAPGQGIVGHVMKTREPLLISDTRLDSRYRVDDISRLSELCVPIIHNNELIGIIDSEHPNVNHFKERDVKILTTIATIVGNKIKQIESEQSLEIKQKEIASVNQQLAEAQLAALQTQMNPHFIFNSLNSIKGMILNNEQQKASRYLSKFAQMIRITLHQSKEIFTTLYENLEHLENYLMMEKLRFDDSFTFHVTVDERIDKEETLVPTLMIQPLSENAIWHGLMCKEGDKKLSIRFCLVGETICCVIEDNGIGIKRSEELKRLNKTTHQSVGLNNLRNRIKIMNEKYDTGCTLQIVDLHDLDKNKTGTRATLQFNIMSNKPQL